MSYINRNSFEINGAFEMHSFGMLIYGTVEVTLGRDTKRVRAILTRKGDQDGDITAYGIIGRYMTGTKAWPGSISSRPGWENDFVHFGFDSRSGKHRKVSISFAQEGGAK